MRMLEWARREIDIAIAKERCDSLACDWYESAYKAFESLTEDGHRVLGINIIRDILDRLIDEKPLTPIEDTEDAWDYLGPNPNSYQCTRMSSLFKYVYDDGSVTYHDVYRAVRIDLETKVTWYDDRACRIIDDKYPIVMPYYPCKEPYKVYSEYFLYKDPDIVGAVNHVAYYYMIKPDGEREEINKFFMTTDEGMVEIPKELFEKHKSEHEKVAAFAHSIMK